MPITVSLPSRDVELEFPDSMTEQEIQAAIDQEYPRSGEDVAFEVEQAKAQSIEGGNLVNPFQDMSRDDYILFRQNLANKKTSLGDFLGIAKDTFTNVIDEIGTGLGTAAYMTAQGELGKVAESTQEGIVAGTIGLADIAAKILKPANKIPSKEEFLKTQIPTEMVSRDTGTGFVGRMPQIVKRPATEADYNALIEQEKQRDVDAINRLYAIEATLKGAPVEEIARGAQNIDPAILTGLGSAAVRSLATKLAGKSIFKPAATAAARTATAPGGLGQAALSGIERAASGVQTAASLPGQALQGIRNVAERVAPGTGAAAQGTALATGLMADMGLTAGTLAGAATAEKVAEVVGAAARAARKEASRVGLLEQAAQDAAISPTARKLAGGLAQLQPAFRAAGRIAAQAAKEGAMGAAVGAGLGYLAERNLEGAAQGAGAGAAFGGLTGTMRSVFDMGREMVGGSTSRTRQQAAGDLNTFLAERPEVEQAAWSQTINRLVEQVGPERAAAQVDAMKIAEANGAKVRVATPDEMKQWQNPGWLDVSTQEVVLNPNKILGDTAAHETSHVLFSSAINRAFKPEIEQAVFGLADPVTGEIIRPGLFDDIALAKVADQIGDSYGKNTQAANEFKGYANVLRNTTDAAALQEARTRIADEMAAAYTGNLFGRLRPGRFNPDRLPLVYRSALNALEDSILDKFRSVLFEKGMDLGFDSVTRTFKDAKGKPIRIPELDAIVKRALAKRGTKAAQAPTAKPDLIPVNPADRAIWARSYGGARGILNDDNTPKTAAQIQAEATARWQDMTQRMAALPETERKGIEFNRDKTGKTVMTAKGQLSPEALNVILDSGTLDPSAKAVLRDVLTSMQNFNKATFDTRYYGVYDRGRGGSKMVAGVKSVSQNEILPYSVEMNSKEGVIIRAVDMTKVRDRLATALTKPQFKDVYASPQAALKDFNLYLENITQINPVDSATLLGGGEKGAKKRNLFYEALGFRLRNNESLLNAPESVISKSQNTVKSYRVERFAKLQDSGNRFAFEEATTYERAMKNFQPDAFIRETLPAGETLTNPDGYRILKKVGSKLYRVYDDQGELIGTTSTEKAAMRKGQDDFAKKANREEPATIRFQFAGESAELPQFMRDSLEAAKAMAKEGKTSEVIRAITGWFPGKYDDKMRWEVPDEKAIIKGTVKADELVFRAWKNATQPRQPDAPTAELQDILRHPDLFNAYPEAARIPIVADVNLSSSGSIGPMAGFEGNVIRVNGALSGERLKSTLLHEIQHWIQEKEGFARGGNVSTSDISQLEAEIISKAISDAQKTQSEPLYQDESLEWILRNDPFLTSSQKQWAINVVKAGPGAIKELQANTPFGRYRRTAGEIEARDVQARQSFTPEQRKAIAPYSSENIAREEAIVLKSAKKANQEERQTRFQPVSPEQDAAYLNAVKAGDTAKAQAMVDEAARIIGINTIRQQNGRLIYNGEDVGTFETTNRADGVVEIDRLYLNKDRQKQGIGGGVIPYLFSKGAKIIEAYPLEESWWLRQSPQSIKPDGSFVFTTPKPSNIKSADPITYDDAGNVIPLSQRFNPETPDIRFQPDPLSPNIQVGSNGTRIIKSPSGKFRVYSATGTLLGIRETEQAAKKLATK